MRRHFLHDRYFDQMDTAEKWYWYGFILADGCIHIRGDGGYQFQLKLADRDRSHLERFRLAIGYQGPLHTQIGLLGERRQLSVSLIFRSRLFCQRLIGLGVVPRKSFGHPIPVVPNWAFWAFARGHFDANGCASYEPVKRQFNVGFSGTARTMRWLLASIRHLSDICGGSFSSRGGVFGVLKFRGNRQVRRLSAWLFGGEGPRLERKFAVLQPLLGDIA